LLAKLAQKTVNNVLATLRRMLVLAAKRGLIPAVPEVEWLRPPAPPFDFLSFEEGERLLAAAPEKWRSMFTLGMRAGLRHGELLGLRWEDVDLVAGRLLVRQAIVRNKVTTPKSGKHREVGLGADATAALKAQRHLRGPYVFCRDDGKPLTKGECIRPLSSTCRRAGLRHIGWHVLRHTFASHLAMRGVPIRVIQELLGHSTIQMTMRYAHLSPEVGREAVLLIDAGHRVPDGVGTGSTWRNRKG
jgi:integrase